MSSEVTRKMQFLHLQGTEVRCGKFLLLLLSKALLNMLLHLWKMCSQHLMVFCTLLYYYFCIFILGCHSWDNYTFACDDVIVFLSVCMWGDFLICHFGYTIVLSAGASVPMVVYFAVCLSLCAYLPSLSCPLSEIWWQSWFSWVCQASPLTHWAAGTWRCITTCLVRWCVSSPSSCSPLSPLDKTSPSPLGKCQGC